MPDARPFLSSVMTVEPEWTDYNGHLNMAYYNVLFDRCVDAAFITLGLGPDYARTHNASFFTLETHVSYLAEITAGDRVRASFQLLDHDGKRAHFVQELRRSDDGLLSAVSEGIIMHVDMGVRRASPFPADVRAQLAGMKAAHSALPVPEQVGHVIGINRR
jgi:acyl-CoA thioester hydrolase